MVCSCPKEYISKLPDGKFYCHGCKMIVLSASEEKEKKEKSYKPISELVMPSPSRRLTRKVWEEVTPWPKIPFSTAHKYQFYLSKLGKETEYIVMPVFRKNKPVFWQARRVATASSYDGPKYCSPYDFKKEYWVSENAFNNERNVLFFVEGIADAAYLSNFGDAIALLGLGYSGEFNKRIPRSKKIVIFLDGDMVGRVNSFRVANKINRPDSVLLFGESFRDPADYDIEELRALCGRHGVRI